MQTQIILDIIDALQTEGYDDETLQELRNRIQSHPDRIETNQNAEMPGGGRSYKVGDLKKSLEQLQQKLGTPDSL